MENLVKHKEGKYEDYVDNINDIYFSDDKDIIKSVNKRNFNTDFDLEENNIVNSAIFDEDRNIINVEYMNGDTKELELEDPIMYWEEVVLKSL